LEKSKIEQTRRNEEASIITKINNTNISLLRVKLIQFSNIYKVNTIIGPQLHCFFALKSLCRKKMRGRDAKIILLASPVELTESSLRFPVQFEISSVSMMAVWPNSFPVATPGLRNMG
jgi:hypothetical protein